MIQRAFRQQIQQGFQRAGERRFINRRGNQQAVGLRQLLGKRLDRRAVEVGVQQVFGIEVVQGISRHFHPLLPQPVLTQREQRGGT